jgi:hypothetical protein
MGETQSGGSIRCCTQVLMIIDSILHFNGRQVRVDNFSLFSRNINCILIIAAMVLYGKVLLYLTMTTL